ncbi:MAG: hypothetical protein ACOCV9_06580 [Marinilabiliaceae bacterium]
MAGEFRSGGFLSALRFGGILSAIQVWRSPNRHYRFSGLRTANFNPKEPQPIN